MMFAPLLRTREARDGRQALEIPDREPGEMELALVDWKEMNGLKLLRQAPANRRHSSVIVVMVAAETELEHMPAALGACVIKPFTREILPDRLRLAGIGC